jgi:hypothetical protein
MLSAQHFSAGTCGQILIQNPIGTTVLRPQFLLLEAPIKKWNSATDLKKGHSKLFPGAGTGFVSAIAVRRPPPAPKKKITIKSIASH